MDVDAAQHITAMSAATIHQERVSQETLILLVSQARYCPDGRGDSQV